jgi:hydrogenase large subunit
MDSDILQAIGMLKKVKSIVETILLDERLEVALEWESFTNVIETRGYLSKVGHILSQDSWENIGQSHDQFIVLGIDNGKGALKSMKTRLVNVDPRHVSESLAHTFFEENGYTYSKSAQYKNRYFETGPLARMMVSKNPLIRDLHRRFKDALVSRILARMVECSYLIHQTFELLSKINLTQLSFIPPPLPIEQLQSFGIGIVEAARGSLMHQISIKDGQISQYDIITPTVWNLGNGTKDSPSIIQKALIGVENIAQADMIFRGFDVCSVCTTQ